MGDGMSERTANFDVIVVGAGMAGLYALHRLRGLGLSVRVFEASDGIGGTWYRNRYPGARVDVESLDYSYSFDPELEQEWEWTERFPTQPELLRYLNHVADRFDLRRDIELNARVVQAHFHEADGLWAVATEDGRRATARWCVMASGCLSAAKPLDVKGLESFEGELHHTARWPEDGVDFAGKRVGVIGTGSSGLQIIPVIAEEAEHLHVFQRTPTFSAPARNRPLTAEEEREIKATYRERRALARTTGNGLPVAGDLPAALETTPEQRQERYESGWAVGGPMAVLGAFNDILVNSEANETAQEFVRSKIREIVRDPATAEALCPKDHPLGTKRMTVDTGYYETFNRDDVTLVDLRKSPIEEITPEGVRTWDGLYELDLLVLATGFDAITGPLLAIDIRGRDGLTLKDKWAEGPRTYLGIQTAGFPNLFTLTGPGSPCVLSNMMTSIEQHVEWVSDTIAYLREHGIDRIEASKDAEDAWVDHVNEVAGYTLFPAANSWYLGANVPGKPRIFMPYLGGCGVYRQKCAE